METSDVSVENVAEDANVAAPVEETAEEPMSEDPAPAEEPAPAGDAEPEARVNGASAEDATEQEPALEPEKSESDSPVPVPEENATAEDEETEPRGVKRRASQALSDASDEFRGFASDDNKGSSTLNYASLIEKMAAEVAAEEASLVRVRRIAIPSRLKRQRIDDGSRSSSSMSHRSDGDTLSSDMGASSPASGRGRRTAPEHLQSPLFRVPLERGWKRELVYRASALDTHSRRQADIYYYTPAGKKLRSNREVMEHIAGSGLTVDNFSFFKEPLGIDDPEKEIIRDAKVRDSPLSSPAPSAAPLEGKRTPKPKPPKGVSPEPKTVQQLRLKVKSQGSRLSGSGRNSIGGDKTPTSISGSSSSWKKPRLLVPPPPPLLCRPTLLSPTIDTQGEPCTMRCPGAPGQVPSLACTVCLCLYHPACAGHTAQESANFLCKNCRVTSGPPPLTHMSGSITPPLPPLTPAPTIINLRPVLRPVFRPVLPPHAIRRYPIPRPVAIRRLVAPQQQMPQRPPIPIAPPAAAAPPRVFLRMKAQGGGGEKVWAVQPMTGAPPPLLTPAPSPATTPAQVPTPATHPTTAATASRASNVPQTVAVINGRKFIVVPKNAAAAAYTQ